MKVSVAWPKDLKSQPYGTYSSCPTGGCQVLHERHLHDVDDDDNDDEEEDGEEGGDGAGDG